MRIDFDWDPAKATSNATKHRVTFEEAMTIFDDPLSVSVLDDESSGEERWVTLGQTPSGNLLLVVHTWSAMDADHITVRLISARRPTRNESRQYRESRMP
jgi:uncharacterized protein